MDVLAWIAWPLPCRHQYKQTMARQLLQNTSLENSTSQKLMLQRVCTEHLGLRHSPPSLFPPACFASVGKTEFQPCTGKLRLKRTKTNSAKAATKRLVKSGPLANLRPFWLRLLRVLLPPSPRPAHTTPRRSSSGDAEEHQDRQTSSAAGSDYHDQACPVKRLEVCM